MEMWNEELKMKWFDRLQRSLSAHSFWLPVFCLSEIENCNLINQPLHLSQQKFQR